MRKNFNNKCYNIRFFLTRAGTIRFKRLLFSGFSIIVGIITESIKKNKKSYTH